MRGASPWPPKGMHSVLAVLLSHLDDESAFWTFNAMVFLLRPADFYSKPPASMNGLLVEQEAAADLMCRLFPSLIAREQVSCALLCPRRICVGAPRGDRGRSGRRTRRAAAPARALARAATAVRFTNASGPASRPRSLGVTRRTRLGA